MSPTPGIAEKAHGIFLIATMGLGFVAALMAEDTFAPCRDAVIAQGRLHAREHDGARAALQGRGRHGRAAPQPEKGEQASPHRHEALREQRRDGQDQQHESRHHPLRGRDRTGEHPGRRRDDRQHHRDSRHAREGATAQLDWSTP